MNIRFPVAISITALALLLLFFQAGILAYTSFSEIEKRLIENSKNELIAQANSLQGVLEFLHHINELEQVQEEVTALGSNKNMRMAVLVDENNTITASTRIEYIGKLIENLPVVITEDGLFKDFLDVRSSLKYHIDIHGQHMMYLMQPVILGSSKGSIRPDRIGVLMFGYDLRWIKSQVIASLISTKVPVLLSLVMLTGLFGGAIYFLYIKRLNEISVAAKKVKGGKYSHRVDVKGSDEISFLGDFFNQMLSSIQSHHRAIENNISEAREREQNLSLTLQSIGDAVIVTDSEGYITRLNSSACRLTAWSENHAVGCHLDAVFKIINSQSREPIPSPVERALKTGEIVGLANDTSLIDKQGKEYQIADSAAPIKDADGVIYGVIMVFQDVTENYKLQHALRENEQRMQLAMEATEEGVWDWNVKTNEVYYSPRWLSMLGYQPGDIAPHVSSWKQLINPEDNERVMGNLSAHLRAETDFYEAEHRLRKKDGSWLWVLGRGKVIKRNDQGEPLRAVGIAVDIGEKIKTQEKEKQRNEQMRSNQNALLEWAKVDYLDVSEAFRKATKLCAETLQVERVGIWLFSASLDQIKCEDLYLLNENRHEKGLVKGQKDFPEYFKALKSDVTLVINDAKNDPLCAECLESYLIPMDIASVLNVPIRLHGEIIGIVSCERTGKTSSWSLEQQEFIISIASTLAISLEADRRQATEKLLRSKETEGQLLLDNLIDGVITIDQTGKILSFNLAAEKIFGYSSADLVGQDVTQLMPEPHKQNHPAYLQHYLETGEEKVIGSTVEVNGVRGNGDIFPLRLSIAELPPDQNMRRFVGSVTDVTQLQINEEKLRRTQKMDAMGKLTGGIAHDYNNMLGVILGYAELLDMQLSDNPKLDKYVKTILHAGERGKKLTKSLLAFSRGKAIKEEPTDINKMLVEEEHLIAKTLTAQVELVLNLADDLWLSKLDKGDLEDAVLNMCINAMHAMPEGGKLTIETSNEILESSWAKNLGIDEGEYVRLYLADTGSGMDYQIKQQLFEPFFTTKGEKGTGLGLSQVYGFVQREKGGIKVDSEPGQGAQFTLYFPRYSVDQDLNALNDIGETDDYDGKEVVLVVDDEKGLRELASEMLARHGYQVVLAEDAFNALKMLEKHKVELLISDVIMPGMNGYELADEVSKKYPHIKIQMMSGFSDDRHVGAKKEKLHKDLLHKPFSSRDLLTRVRHLLNE